MKFKDFQNILKTNFDISQSGEVWQKTEEFYSPFNLFSTPDWLILLFLYYDVDTQDVFDIIKVTTKCEIKYSLGYYDDVELSYAQTVDIPKLYAMLNDG